MSIVLVCPHCGKSGTYDRRPIDTCPHCFERLPDDLIEEGHRSFDVRRPLGLSIYYGFTWFFGVMFVFAILGGLSGRGTYELNGVYVSPSTFVAVLGISLVPLVMFLYSVKRRKSWFREALLMKQLIGICAMNVGSMFPLDDRLAVSLGVVLVSIVFTALIFMGITSLYLYQRKSVKRYYEELLWEEENLRG